MRQEKTGSKSFLDHAVFNTRIRSQNVTPKEMLGGYFLAPLCALLSNQIFSAYLNRYYVDVLDWTRFGTFATLLPIVSVVFVILGNVLVGTWIDKTRTRQGKARPYLLLSVPLLVAAILLLFRTPADAGAGTQMVWIAVTYNLYYAIAYPCYYTAHNSLVSLSTRNSGARGMLATLSNAAIVAAAGLGGSILVPILLQSYMFVSGAAGLDVNTSFAHWKVLSAVFAILTAAGIIGEYFLTRERITEEAAAMDLQEKKTVPTREHVQACLHEPYWWMIILFILVFQLGQQFKNGSMNFFVRWVLDDVVQAADPEQTAGTLTSALGLVGGLPSALGMLVIWPITNRFGKKNALLAGSVIALLGGLAAFVNVHRFGMVCLGVVLKTIGIIPAQYVLLALLSDVLDHMEAKNGFRSDGFTMAIYSAIYAGLAGVCNGILNGALSRAGYVNTGIRQTLESGAQVFAQTAQVQRILVLMYLGIDMICFAVCIVLVLRLDVEKHLDEDHALILAHQKQRVLEAGGTWIDPKERAIREQEQADQEAEEARIRELQETCKRKHLDVATENQKYLEKKRRQENGPLHKLLKF